VKRFNMDKQTTKDVICGGLAELIDNPRYYYYSGVGQQYSHWTDEGQTSLLEYMEIMAWHLKEAEYTELDKRAKVLVINGLKGEKV